MKTLWISILLLGALLGFFHIVTTTNGLTFVPKTSFTYLDTFISLEDVIERQNSRTFAEAMRGDPPFDSLVRNLEKRGYLSSTEKADIRSQSSADIASTPQSANAAGVVNQVSSNKNQFENSLPSSEVLMQTAIRLRPMKGEKSLLVEGKSISGSCDGSVVKIVGVSKVYENLYSLGDDGRIFIRSATGKLLIIGEDMRVLSDNNTSVLSDHNGMACVSTQAGDRLLIWSVCGGFICTGGYSFYIIDPKQLVFVAPGDPIKDFCNEDCASKLLGNGFPKQLHGSK